MIRFPQEVLVARPYGLTKDLSVADEAGDEQMLANQQANPLISHAVERLDHFATGGILPGRSVSVQP